MSLARPLLDFSSGAFAPAVPPPPAVIDQAADGLPRPQPRRWQFPPAWNMPSPPGTEGVRLTTFDTLRAYADMSSFLRACIDKRIEEILGLEWDIVPTLEAEKSEKNYGDSEDFQDRRLKALRWWSRPDPEFDTFHSWLRAILEDIFVIDAVSLYVAPPKVAGHGLFGTDLAALALIDGATIRPLLDMHGGRPQPPAVAFQQYIFGVPRVDLIDIINQTDLDDDMGEPDAALRGDQLLYLPYRRRSKSPYGFSHVEACLVPAGIELNKQKYALDYYHEGNVPPAWVTIGNADTPQQIRQWQDTLDAMVGDVGARHQVMVLPHGSTTSETKPNAFVDSYDMANKEEILAVFGLTAMEMGMMPSRQSAGGGGMAGSAQLAQNAQDNSIRTATKPLLQFLKRNLFDLILQQFAGQQDMQWKWAGLEPVEDAGAKIGMEVQEVEAGLRSRDEVRIEHGWQPWDLALTKTPTVSTKDGVVSLADTTQNTMPPAAAPTTDGGDGSGTDDNGDGSTQQAQPKPQSSSLQDDSKKTPLHAAASTSDEVRHGNDGTDEPTKMLIAELTKSVGPDRAVLIAERQDMLEHDPLYAKASGRIGLLLNSVRRGAMDVTQFQRLARHVIGDAADGLTPDVAPTLAALQDWYQQQRA